MECHPHGIGADPQRFRDFAVRHFAQVMEREDVGLAIRKLAMARRSGRPSRAAPPSIRVAQIPARPGRTQVLRAAARRTAAAIGRWHAASPTASGGRPNCGSADARAVGRLPTRPPARRLPCRRHGPTAARQCRMPLPRACGRLIPNLTRRPPDFQRRKPGRNGRAHDLCRRGQPEITSFQWYSRIEPALDDVQRPRRPFCSFANSADFLCGPCK